MKPERPTELPPEIAAKLEKRKRFPRARRWLFNVAAALSLLLFVGNYWLWVRGVRGIEDAYGLSLVGGHLLLLSSYGGQLNFEIQNERFYSEQDRIPPNGFQSIEWNTEVTEPQKQAMRVDPRAIEWFYLVTSEIGLWLIIPKWFLQLLFAILPLWWLGRSALRWSERKKARAASSL